MSTGVVLQQYVVLALIAATGALARRWGWVDARATAMLGRLVVDLAFPALVLVQLVGTTDRAQLVAGWVAPVAGAALLIAGTGLAAIAIRAAGLEDVRTLAFSAGLPNWIYLPLPIAEATWGADGVRAVLLVHVGATAVLWTLGVAWLSGRAHPRGLLAPGPVSVLVGLAWVAVDPPAAPLALRPVADAGWQALEMLGATAIPLTLVVLGAQLGGARPRRPDRATLTVVALRLLALPAITVAALAAVGFGEGPLIGVLVLVAAMPTAVSAAAIAERYGGDPERAGAAILWTTPLSLLTVPLVVAFAELIGAIG